MSTPPGPPLAPWAGPPSDGSTPPQVGHTPRPPRNRRTALVLALLCSVAVLAALAVVTILWVNRPDGRMASSLNDLYRVDACTVPTDADRAALGIIGPGKPGRAQPGQGCVWHTSSNLVTALVLVNSDRDRIENETFFRTHPDLSPNLHVYQQTISDLPVDFIGIDKQCTGYVTVDGIRSAISISYVADYQDTACSMVSQFISRLEPRLP